MLVGCNFNTAEKCEVKCILDLHLVHTLARLLLAIC